MNNELDPEILALFDAAKQAPLDDGFVASLMAQIDRERRRTMGLWGLAALLFAAVFALLAGPIFAALELVGQLLPASIVEIEAGWLKQLLSPVNSVAAALAIGVLLVRRFWRSTFG